MSIWSIICLFHPLSGTWYISSSLLLRIYTSLSCINDKRKLRKNSNGSKESQFKLLVPALIILTFILFTILPDLYCTFIGSFSNEFSLSISVTLYSAGWIADSVIIIYDFKFSKLKKKFNRRRETVSAEM